MPEKDLAEAERIIKAKMLDFQQAEQRKKLEAEKKVLDRVERGTMKPETAMKKLEAMPEVQKAVATESGAKVSFRTVRKVQFTDPTFLAHNALPELVKKGYLVWDEVKAKRDALAGIEITGATIVEEQEIAAR